jgi:hypothetical protein
LTCPNCGAANSRADNFCWRCGTPLKAEAAAARVTPPSVSAPGRPTGESQTPRSEYIYGGPGAGNPFVGTPVPPPMTPPSAFPPPAQSWQPTLAPVGRTSRSPVVGALAIGGAVLLLLLGIGAVFLAGNLRPQAAVMPTPDVSVPAPAVGGYQPANADERAVIAAVEANNAAQITALRTLDPHALDGTMTGQALKDNQTMIQDLQSRGLYQVARLIRIDYQQPRFIGTDQASIRTVEQWESTIYQRSNTTEAGSQPPQTLHEIYYLTRTNGQWIVDQVDIQEEQQGTPAPSN